MELKSGHNYDGPAWIGKGFFSKTGRTVYFNGLALSKGGLRGNHYEVLSGDEYWISGIKKAGSNRHWAGNGKINIDKNAIPEYLKLINSSLLPKNQFDIVDLQNDPPIQASKEFFNLKF